jgi:glycosyltransferase involved in cell wall biosynthesis
MELHVRLPHEPVFHHRLLAQDETRLLVEAMEELLRQMGTRDAVQIVSLPTWFDAALEIRRRYGFRIVYDCHDLLSGFDNMAPEIVAAEARLFAEADQVIFSSRTLMDAHPATHGKALLIRNGADVARFSPRERKSRTTRVVGYVGAIEAWFDIAMMQEAARANPQCRFRIAGRNENPAVEQLRELPNVELLGEVAYDNVPELVGQFDVGLIPFVVNDLTRAADPIKLYEYFACGIPVVSSPLPEVEPQGDLVYLASDAPAFAAAVRTALADDDPVRTARRIEVASRSSWMERSRELYRAIVPSS